MARLRWTSIDTLMILLKRNSPIENVATSRQKTKMPNHIVIGL